MNKVAGVLMRHTVGANSEGSVVTGADMAAFLDTQPDPALYFTVQVYDNDAAPVDAAATPVTETQE